MLVPVRAEEGSRVILVLDASGAYHVVAKSGDGTVIGEKDVEVKAGARTEGSIP